MSALGYLVRRNIVNRLKNLLHKPGLLVFYVIIIGCLVFSMFARDSGDIPAVGGLQDYLEPLALLLFIWILLSSFKAGTSRGATLFSMADVNLLFTAPVAPRRILLYGIVQQMGMVLITLFVFICQIPNLKNFFGLPVEQSIILLLIATVLIFLGRLLTMLVYAFAAGNSRRIRIMKGLFYLCLAAVVLSVLLPLMETQNLAGTAQAFYDNPAIRWFPIAGWFAQTALGLMAGTLPALPLVLSLSSIILVIAGLLTVQPDYFEDVLQNSEYTQKIRDAAKSGQMQSTSTRKIRINREGLGGGTGAGVFLRMHIISLRRKGFFLFDGFTLFYILVSVCAYWLFSESYSIALSLFMCVYLYSLLMGNGPALQELTRPYIYLGPDTPWRKCLYLSLSNVIKCMTDGILIFGLTALIHGIFWVDAALCVIAFGTFSLVSSANNLLVSRILADSHRNGLVLMAYFLFEILLILPGILAFILLPIALPTLGVYGGYAAMILINTGIGFLVLFLCRGILHNMETT